MVIAISVLAILLILWLVIGFVIFNLSLKSRETNSLFKKDDEEKKTVDVGCAKYYKQVSITGSDGISLNGKEVSVSSNLSNLYTRLWWKSNRNG